MGLFSGIRQCELGRIEWKDITPGKWVATDSDDAKDRKTRRLVPMQPVLNAWLEPFYGLTGPVMPVKNIQDTASKLIRSLQLPWRRNGPRRSYASYRLAQTRDVIKTAEEDGHSAYILERDYKERVTRKAAGEYFRLTPKACGKANWAQMVADYLASQSSCWPTGDAEPSQTVATLPEALRRAA
jgi:hypothetical protein